MCAEKPEDVDPCNPPGSSVQNIAHGQRRLLICEEEGETELSPLLPVAAATEGLVSGALILPIVGTGFAAAGVASGAASSPEGSQNRGRHYDGAAHARSMGLSPAAAPSEDSGGMEVFCFLGNNLYSQKWVVAARPVGCREVN